MNDKIQKIALEKEKVREREREREMMKLVKRAKSQNPSDIHREPCARFSRIMVIMSLIFKKIRGLS